MAAPTILAFFNAVYLLALTAWVGGLAFYSFGVAPLVVRVLGPEAGGKLLRALIPRCHAWGATAGAIALPAVVCGPLAFAELRGRAVGVQAILVLIATLLMFYGGAAVAPALEAASRAGSEGTARLAALHRRSLRLNGVAVLIGVGLLASFAIRQVPRSGGIVERGPGELSPGQEKLLRDADAIQRRQAAILEGKEPPPRGLKRDDLGPGPR